MGYLPFYLLNNSFDNIFLNFSTGLVLGRKSKPTDSGVEGFVFLGIPYAKPPLKELRYRKPQDPEPFTRLFNATQFGNACLWNSTITNQKLNYTKMDEDCLQINVYTSKKCLLDSDCSVAFYIHGGGYNFDSPMILNESVIVENFAKEGRDVVFVTFQYREGSFGFLNLNYKLNLTADTNVGMFDMLQALKWVKKEISNFGGDPNKITLTGHSSGSNAASYLFVSPKGKDLIHQGLFMSGTRKSPLYVDNNQNVSRIIAIEAGCAFDTTNWDNIDDVEKVIECLKKIEGPQLAAIQGYVETFGLRMNGPHQDFGPNSFFELSVKELMDDPPKVNVMTGTVSEEQADGLSAIEESSNGTKFVNKQKLQVLCQSIFASLTIEHYEPTIQACIEEYSSDLYRTKHIIDDVVFFIPHLNDARSVAKAGGKSYLYQFNYSVPFGVIDFKNNYTFLKTDSPRHSDEIVYLYGLHMGRFGDKERKIAEKFSKIITDFINHGEPTSEEVQWTPFKPSMNNYFVIDFDDNLTMPGMARNYHERANTFWNDIIPKIEGKVEPNFFETNYINLLPLINMIEDNYTYSPIIYPQSYYKNSTPPKIADTLSLGGHNVTLMTLGFSSLEKSNLTKYSHFIYMPVSVRLKNEIFNGLMFDKMWEASQHILLRLLNLNILGEEFLHTCEYIFDQDEITETIRSSHFDIMISEIFILCPLALSTHYGIKKNIFTSPFPLSELAYSYLGLYFPTSSIPTQFLRIEGKMSFSDRMSNYIFYTVESLYLKYVLKGQLQAVYMRKNNGKLIDTEKVFTKSSAIFINTMPFVDFQTPLTPRMHYIGGIALSKPKPLNKFFDNLLSIRKYNVFFSLGTLVYERHMPKSLKIGLFESFSKLPHVTFIVSFPIHNITFKLPDNVYIYDWIPQNDLLHDDRLNLFITHGGQNSINEAVAAGRCMLSIPVFGDQERNSGMILRLKIGHIFNKVNLKNSELLKNTIWETINDKECHKNSKKVQKLYNLFPYKSNEIVLKVTEYIGNTEDFNEIIFDSAYLNVIEFFNLDVIFVLFFLLFIKVLSIYLIAKFLYNQKIVINKIKLD
uniref:glucuronosyltransferase n=1 Tax=Parastrongyloides trichosuri TaxID=131310 RepID=A0A0N4ZE07_PARTI